MHTRRRSMSDVTASWKEDTKIRVIPMYFSSAVK